MVIKSEKRQVGGIGTLFVPALQLNCRWLSHEPPTFDTYFRLRLQLFQDISDQKRLLLAITADYFVQYAWTRAPIGDMSRSRGFAASATARLCQEWRIRMIRLVFIIQSGSFFSSMDRIFPARFRDPIVYFPPLQCQPCVSVGEPCGFGSSKAVPRVRT